MNWIFCNRVVCLVLFSTGGLTISGCGSSETGAPQTDGTSVTKTDYSHGGWWCVEHGVPEADCAQCDSSLVDKFKADGDWCEEHNRPESQCFQCSPARAEKFAKLYEVKVGRAPPKVEE